MKLRALPGLALATLALGACDSSTTRTEEDAALAPGADAMAASDGASPPAVDARVLADGGAADGSTLAQVDDLRFENGTRLKRVALRSPGAVDLLLGWYDSELDVECLVTSLGTGQPRCLPTAIVGSTGYYADPQCGSEIRTSVATACTGVPIPSYAAEVRGGDCSTVVAHAVSPAPTNFLQQPFYRKQNGAGACEAISATEHDDAVARWRDYDVLLEGAAIDVARFATFDGDETSDGSPRVTSQRGSDGARQQLRIVDAQGTTCTPMRLPAGDVCVPRSKGPSSMFADATCTMPVVAGDESFCNPIAEPPTLQMLPPPACSAETVAPRFFALGEKLSGSLYLKSTGCSLYETSFRPSYYRIGAELTTLSFPALDSKVEGSGRLRMRSFYDDKGRRIAVDTKSVYDSQLGQRCDVNGRPIDGRVACKPALEAWVAYLDAACTQSVLATGCGDAQPGFVTSIATDGSAMCPRPRFARLGAPVVISTPTFVRSGASCTASAQPPAALFALGADVPVTALATFERVRMP